MSTKHIPEDKSPIRWVVGKHACPEWVEGFEYLVVELEDRSEGVCIVGNPKYKEAHVKARLLAASPELLEACVRYHNATCAVIDALNDGCVERIAVTADALRFVAEQSSAAIAKATGEGA